MFLTNLSKQSSLRLILVALGVLIVLISISTALFLFYTPSNDANNMEAHLKTHGFKCSQPNADKDNPEVVNIYCITPYGGFCTLTHKNGELVEFSAILDLALVKQLTIDSVVVMIEPLAPDWNNSRDWVTVSVQKKAISEEVRNNYRFTIDTTYLSLFQVVPQ